MTCSCISAASFVLESFHRLLNLSADECSEIGSPDNPIPKFPETVLDSLCDQAIDTLKHESHLIKVPIPCVVIGDLHGNLHDLLRIWTSLTNPYDQHILFLGDFVDRGCFSIEVISLVLALKVEYPGHVHMIRGNHEFRDINMKYGFRDDIDRAYAGDRLWNKFNTVFNYLPLCALLGGSWFCVHGGLSPDFKTLSQLDEIPFPLTEMTPGIVTNLVWSDPTPDVKTFQQNPRGAGCAFGSTAVDRFLITNGLKRIIRAHEQQKEGIEVFRNVTTVFSTSGYSAENLGAFLIVMDEMNYKVKILKPIKYRKRLDCVFRQCWMAQKERKIRGFLSANLTPTPLLRVRRTSQSMALFPQMKEPNWMVNPTFL